MNNNIKQISKEKWYDIVKSNGYVRCIGIDCRECPFINNMTRFDCFMFSLKECKKYLKIQKINQILS